MTVEQLKSVMKFHLKNFNDEGVSIDNETIHKSVLSEDDGFGTANSKSIYKALIRRTLVSNGHEDKRWPDSWMDLSVNGLAPRLLDVAVKKREGGIDKMTWCASTRVRVLLLLVASCQLIATACAADDPAEAGSPFTVSVGPARTSLGLAAIRFLVKYTEGVYDVFITNAPEAKRGWLFALSPAVTVETGDRDAFSSVVVQVTGNMIGFRDTTIDGVWTPNSAARLDVFPISIGGETNGGFTRVNALVELGYVPWYQNIPGTPQLLRKTKIGVFIQSGFKFKGAQEETTGSPAAGAGTLDESKEGLNAALMRIKGSVGFTPTFMITDRFGVGPVVGADVWWDMIHTVAYYKVDLALRLLLSPGKEFALTYQYGSGPPNFNKGSQFSANIAVQF